MLFFIFAYKFVGTFKQAPQAIYVKNSYIKKRSHSDIIDKLFMKLPETIGKNKKFMKRKVIIANIGFIFVIANIFLILLLVSLLIYCFI